MTAQPVPEVHEIEVQLQEVFCDNIPGENDPVVTEWLDEASNGGRTAVLSSSNRVIGYLPSRYDPITSMVCHRGVVTGVRRGDDPFVTVRLTASIPR